MNPQQLSTIGSFSNQSNTKDSRFYIENQESLVTEKFSKNGRTMDLHLVAKNVSFNVHLVSTIDMNNYPPTAKLIYDWDEELEEDKEVEHLKTPPLEIITHVDRSGRKANVETKISVLSSQHERSFFRIKFSIVDLLSDELLVDYSQPIKVIAKRNQIRKMLERKLQSQVKNETSIVSTPVGVVNLAQLAPKREKPTQESILETLKRIEMQQKEQYRFMQQIADKILLNPRTETLNSTPKENSNPENTRFVESFKKFLESFEEIEFEERPNKMRKLISSIDKSHTKNLEDFVKLYNMEAKAPLEEISNTLCSNYPSSQCPHKTELEMLNNLYSDFLKDPVSPDLT